MDIPGVIIRIMRDRLFKYWNDQPLLIIMGLAVFFRILSVIFAKGWGMMDDHFLVIESAQSFVDGYDYNSWLPGSTGNKGPTGHSFFYPGLHFLLFTFLKWIHINDPQTKMFIVRLLHAAWSLLTVFFGYKITEKLGDKKSARMAALLLAVLWFMPWMSVRNLVEMICIPFLILAVWFIVSRENQQGQFPVYFLAGLFLGFAFNIRPQTAFFTLGLGFAVILLGRWKGIIALILGTLIPIILIQGLIDFFIWNKPFVEVYTYISVNFASAGEYITMPWYQYFLVVLGLLIPPVSFFLFFGFLREWKRILIIFLPVAVFFIFHSWIVNKQERFILPVIPFIIMTGTIGWNDFVAGSSFWQKRSKLLKACWIFFWAVNIVGLPVVSVVYSKKARIETMRYLSKYKDIREILVADCDDSPELFPLFYLGQWPHIYEELDENETTDALMQRIAQKPPEKHPDFILFTGESDISSKVIRARKYFPFIVYEKTIEPGFIDIMLHWLNPINKNRTVYIYRNRQFYPNRIE